MSFFWLCFNLDLANVAVSILFFASNYINQFFTYVLGWVHKAQLSVIIEEGLSLISLVGQRRLMIIHACLDKEGTVRVCKSLSIETIRPSLCFSFCRSVYNWSKILFIKHHDAIKTVNVAFKSSVSSTTLFVLKYAWKSMTLFRPLAQQCLFQFSNSVCALQMINSLNVVLMCFKAETETECS